MDRARKLGRLREGLGAVQVDGMIVDAASIRILNNTLRKADHIGM